MITIGILKEIVHKERRVALIPAMIPKLLKQQFSVCVETESGVEAGFSDDDYRKNNASIESRKDVLDKSDVILQVHAPTIAWDDNDTIKPNQTFIGFSDPLGNPKKIEQIANKGLSLLSMEMMPRITRAQSMDALSSMATIAGYKAVLLAASKLPRMFPMLMTAAGTIKPAKVFVIGAGVAGLQAIATAKRLGAKVEAYDVRPQVKEQIESLGAKFIELNIKTEDTEDAGGYAKAGTEDFYNQQRQELARIIAHNDIVITTAAIPGRKAPLLVTHEAVSGMTPGSVIVDLASETGGNCALTQSGETVVTDNHVSIIDSAHITSTVAYHASQMYSQNITTFLLHIFGGETKSLNLNDEIIQGTLLIHEGTVKHPRIIDLLKTN